MIKIYPFLKGSANIQLILKFENGREGLRQKGVRGKTCLRESLTPCLSAIRLHKLSPVNFLTCFYFNKINGRKEVGNIQLAVSRRKLLARNDISKHIKNGNSDRLAEFIGMIKLNIQFIFCWIRKNCQLPIAKYLLINRNRNA